MLFIPAASDIRIKRSQGNGSKNGSDAGDAATTATKGQQEATVLIARAFVYRGFWSISDMYIYVSHGGGACEDGLSLSLSLSLCVT